MTAKIVLLNGVGSAGKSSIARALQPITASPFLHVQMDRFIEMLPDALQDHPDGFSYETTEQDGKPAVVIRIGPVGARTLGGMRHAIAPMAAQGNNLIVDDVLCYGEISEYLGLLSGFDLHLVGVMAPLEVLEAREARRDGRLPGLARWQYERVHKDIGYDLEVDTCRLTPLECARRIQQEFRL
ncbi:chloramphenicol phosphotransferase [Mesorhizobium intechi]|uniref:phosphotransferase-like protein n=1 Tax=Mesorhizobium intechi TaxID=537601 RepID=UPI000CCB1C71|nr:chloramphenicol phosphotransferase [Mesorhizobium intechi]TSD99876.1 chloramphenicol phosphotransferase [Mesorhizobium intechi]